MERTARSRTGMVITRVRRIIQDLGGCRAMERTGVEQV